MLIWSRKPLSSDSSGIQIPIICVTFTDWSLVPGTELSTLHLLSHLHNSLSQTNTHSWPYCSTHFTGGATEVREITNLLRVAWLESGWATVQVQAVSSRAQSYTMLCGPQHPLKTSSFQLNPLSLTKLCHWYHLVCLALNFLSLKIEFWMQVPQSLMSRHHKPRTEGQNGDGQLAKAHMALPTRCMLRIQSELHH